MGSKSEIEWCDATWTPIRARVKSNAPIIAAEKGYTSLIQIAVDMAGHVGPHCEHASPGCEHCYSETNNGRCLPNNGTGLPFDQRARDLVDIFVDEKILLQPLKWRAPKKVFVCSQTDLFGEWVPDEVIDRVMVIMRLARRHTFQLLTKRAERMESYFANPNRPIAIDQAAEKLFNSVYVPVDSYIDIAQACGMDGWPFPNVWLGVSDEGNQHQRIDILRQVPAAVRFVSFEPLIYDPGEVNLEGIHWAIPGGESGAKARPCNLQWVRSLIRQCRASGVAPFVKQAGAVPMMSDAEWRALLPKISLLNASNRKRVPEGFVPLKFKDRSGGDISEWPEDLRVRQFPGVSL